MSNGTESLLQTRQRGNPLGLYVHFPWCVRKCPYCDFNSHPLKGSLDEAGYLAALQTDLAQQLEDVAPRSITSVFFGGGTPSLFNPGTFAALLKQVDRYLADDAEVTMEANPGTTEHKNLGGYRSAGINRLSFGAQSFDPAQLLILGRIHGVADINSSFAAARRGGFDNINLDLMYGLPGQTPQAALADLGAALELQPEHLSWYQLTIEPRTEFARRPPAAVAEEDVAAMEAAGYERLAAAGFARYEVSAFARPGRECRHNLTYWSYGDYLGIGAGAHGKRSLAQAGADGRPGSIERTSKPRQPRLYLAEPTATARRAVPADELVGEFVLNALRLVNGVSIAGFHAATGLTRANLEPTWSTLQKLGLMRADRLAATSEGFRYLDSLIERFL